MELWVKGIEPIWSIHHNQLWHCRFHAACVFFLLFHLILQQFGETWRKWTINLITPAAELIPTGPNLPRLISKLLIPNYYPIHHKFLSAQATMCMIRFLCNCWSGISWNIDKSGLLTRVGYLLREINHEDVPSHCNGGRYII